MKSILAQLSKALTLTLLLISPMIVVPYFSAINIFASKPPPVTRIVFKVHQSPSIHPKESKFALLLAQKSLPEVLGTQTGEVVKSETENNNFNPSSRGTYTIALLGDSMIDVMQPDLPQLASTLKEYYPNAQFKLLNYGVGASDMEYALTRLTNDYSYLGQEFPALLSQNPDIIVVESFAYNHWENSQSGLDRQWLTLAKIVETIKTQSGVKIVLAATVGPDETTLCDGIDGISLPPDQKREKAQTIRVYLQNIINFANSQDYPIADAYHASLDSQGNGKSVYINAGDHLHPSGPGGELFAQKIAKTIYQNSLP